MPGCKWGSACLGWRCWCSNRLFSCSARDSSFKISPGSEFGVGSSARDKGDCTARPAVVRMLFLTTKVCSNPRAPVQVPGQCLCFFWSTMLGHRRIRSATKQKGNPSSPLYSDGFLLGVPKLLAELCRDATLRQSCRAQELRPCGRKRQIHAPAASCVGRFLLLISLSLSLFLFFLALCLSFCDLSCFSPAVSASLALPPYGLSSAAWPGASVGGLDSGPGGAVAKVRKAPRVLNIFGWSLRGRS